MSSVSITELKAHLSEYLRRVQAGESFHVTHRGADIARVTPPDPVHAALMEMVANGEAEWNGERVRLSETRFINTGKSVSDIVLEDRGPRWDEPDDPST